MPNSREQHARGGTSTAKAQGREDVSQEQGWSSFPAASGPLDLRGEGEQQKLWDQKLTSLILLLTGSLWLQHG